MNQQLQVLNTSLVSIALSVGAIYFFCLQPIPTIHSKRNLVNDQADAKLPKPAIVPEFIYQNDLFGTFNPLLPSVKKDKQIPSVPQFSFKPISPAPSLKLPEMMQPLSLILNGIVLASEADKSIAIISDDTLKESIFYVGDQIKDAFIAKILKNSVVLFRSNGQQEVFFLRKEDEIMKKGKDATEWSSCIALLGQNQYQIDAYKWMERIPNLGVFFELCRIMPAIKNDQEYVGMFVADQENTDFIKELGLKPRDLIVSVNNIELINRKKLMKVYEEVLATKEEGTIEVQIIRDKKPLKLIYVRREIEPTMPISFMGSSASKPSTPLALEAQKKEEERKRVEQAPFVKPDPRHAKMMQKKSVESEDSSDYYDTIMKIRKRLVDNMNQRSPYTHKR